MRKGKSLGRIELEVGCCLDSTLMRRVDVVSDEQLPRMYKEYQIVLHQTHQLLLRLHPMPSSVGS